MDQYADIRHDQSCRFQRRIDAVQHAFFRRVAGGQDLCRGAVPVLLDNHVGEGAPDIHRQPRCSLCFRHARPVSLLDFAGRY